jgi:maleate isomerase
VSVFGCTSASALQGRAADRALTERIAQITGAPTISVIDAVRDALQRFGVRRIAVATPYTDAVAERIVDFVADKLGQAGADAIFVSCTNFRAVEALDQLRTAVGVPVTSSNAATIDAVRRHLGRTDAAEVTPATGLARMTRSLTTPAVTSNVDGRSGRSGARGG